jgi:hypothetical protein
MCDSIWGFGLKIGFIHHFTTRLATALNYNAIANFHTVQITTTHAYFFPTCCYFTSSSLITASNSGDSSASAFKSSPFRLPRFRNRVRITLRLAVNRQSVRLGDKPLEYHDQ